MTGSKLGKEYIKAIYCHPAYPFVFIIQEALRRLRQETLWEKLAGIGKWGQREVTVKQRGFLSDLRNS